MRITGWGASDVGRKRHHNEDSLLCNNELSLFAVADGMGGHLGGERGARPARRSSEPRDREGAARERRTGRGRHVARSRPNPVGALLRQAVIESGRAASTKRPWLAARRPKCPPMPSATAKRTARCCRGGCLRCGAVPAHIGRSPTCDSHRRKSESRRGFVGLLGLRRPRVRGRLRRRRRRDDREVGARAAPARRPDSARPASTPFETSAASMTSARA